MQVRGACWDAPKGAEGTADVIARSLPIIFETSWRLEEIPEIMKKIIFTVIFKKGKKEDSENYSQVRLTSDLHHRR